VGTLVETQVAHIWRRLGFGATGTDIDHGVAVGPNALIKDLMSRKLTTPAQWNFTTGVQWQDQVTYLGQQLQLMSSSPNPLQERLAWILQGLVVVGLVDAVQFPDLKAHVARLRTNPMGSYTQLLRDTAIMTGMMQYLNGDQNSVDHPNQNYARELMELFSLGLKNLVTGATNYTQNDVVEIARALTGYTYDWTNDAIVFDPTQFDSGTKTFFGVSHPKAGTWQVITSVSNHPSYRYFVPARLYRELTGLQPTTATLKSLGALWGNTGNVHAVVEAIVTSPTFLSPAAMSNRVKTPVELLVSGARVMGFDLGPTDYGWQLSDFMNQHPFYPPNVSGWPEGKIWLNSGVTMMWSSIVQDFATASLASSTGKAAQLVAKANKAGAVGSALHMCGLVNVSTTTMKALTSYVNAAPWDRTRASGLLALILVSPEFAIN
jgi:uncharacterized protein (DUF1800 family)